LLLASVLAPPLSVLLVAKPTTGFALWLACPRIPALVGGLVLVLVTLAIRPDWIAEWVRGVSDNPHRALVTRPGGALLLLGFLRWRRPDGRLLAGLSIVPQTTSAYETLPLILLIRTRFEALGFAILTMLANVLHQLGPRGPWPIGAEYQWWVLWLLVYIPAVVLVLTRRNVSEPPVL
jgi:hypothetical protein